jgi:hypothetical protein
VDSKALILAAVVWVLFNLLARKKRPPVPPKGQQRVGSGAARPVPPPVRLDPTQREGSQLEQLLLQLGRTLDQSGGPLGRAPDRSLPSAEEQEDRESLEVAPVVRSLETNDPRSTRMTVDQDDDAERVVARRIAEGEGRSRALSKADHLAFDQRIRQEPADKTATRVYSTRRLREAVVWREILGPPVSLRDPTDT